MNERTPTQAAELVLLDHPYKVECPGVHYDPPEDAPTVTAFVTHFKNGATRVCCPRLWQWMPDDTPRCKVHGVAAARAPRCAYAVPAFGREAEEASEPPPPAPALSKNLTTPITELHFSSVRSRKCMARLGINTIGQLVAHTADQLLEIKNFGTTALNEVREKLASLGLKLHGE